MPMAVSVVLYTLPLERIKAQHVPLVGGKAVPLGELCRAGVRVPPGFVVTATAYRAFVEATGLRPRLAALSACPAAEIPSRLPLSRRLSGRPRCLM